MVSHYAVLCAGSIAWYTHHAAHAHQLATQRVVGGVPGRGAAGGDLLLVQTTYVDGAIAVYSEEYGG